MADTLGEFELLVLLAVLQLEGEAQAARVRERIEEGAGRRVTRGALYATLERLETKGYLDWQETDAVPERGGIPGRRFLVTRAGVAAVRRSRAAVRELSRGLERLLGEV